MKILMLGSKEYPFNVSYRYDKKAGGGMEIHVEKLTKYLSEHGNDVFIITRRFPGQRGKEDTGRIHVYRTKFVYNKYLRAPSFNFFSFLKALRLVRKERIDIIHCHGALSGTFGSMFSKLTRIPMVFTPHGVVTGWGFPFKEILKLMEIISVKSAKKTLFISKNAQEELNKMRFPNVLLTNALDLDDYVQKERKWKEVRFLFLGRLEKVKGIDSLLEAFEELSKKCPDAELYIAGSGTMRDRITDFVKNTKSKTRFLGWVTDTPKIYSETDVFVLPSWEKGQPVALLEAMASGKVIITSLNYVKDNETGLIVKPGDSEDLSRKMINVCRSFPKYKKLGINARKSVSNLDWKIVSKDFWNEYKKVINREKNR